MASGTGEDMMLNLRTISRGASVGALALCLASGAHAQDTVAEEASGLEEIVVTAQKRSESINKVGMSINAFSGDQLVQKNITNPSELVRVIPGFTFTEAPRGAPIYAIRGVGFDDSTLGRSEEHTSELQSLMRISYAVLCLKKTKEST